MGRCPRRITFKLYLMLAMRISVSSWRLVFLSLVFTGHFPVAQAQALELDSLRALIRGTPDDTNRVKQYYAYGDALAPLMPDSALWYYDLAKKRAVVLGHDMGIAAYASHAIVILNNQGRFREALEISKEALERYLAMGPEREIAIAYINVGSEWQYLSDFQSAADNYLKAMKIAETVGDQRLQRVTNNNLASIFISLNDYEKGQAICREGLWSWPKP